MTLFSTDLSTIFFTKLVLQGFELDNFELCKEYFKMHNTCIFGTLRMSDFLNSEPKTIDFFLEVVKDTGIQKCIDLVLKYQKQEYEEEEEEEEEEEKDPKLVKALSEALFIRCKEGKFNQSTNFEAIRMLLEKGADPNYENGKILRYCTQQKHFVEIIGLLINYGAKIQYNGYEAITNAAKVGPNTLIKVLSTL
jgi:hypothetical protein